MRENFRSKQFGNAEPILQGHSIVGTPVNYVSSTATDANDNDPGNPQLRSPCFHRSVVLQTLLRACRDNSRLVDKTF